MTEAMKPHIVRVARNSESSMPKNSHITEVPKDVSLDKEKREEVRQLLETIVKQMVPMSESISVRFVMGPQTTIFHIDCDKMSIGHLIGKGGASIDALRKITLAITSFHGFRSVIEVPYFPRE